ncbi:MAG: hypothetical protein IJA75_00005 [Oscillospiraceae bacterium]|nr:hypothetical protein [Oscillospiraceae bacterium]
MSKGRILFLILFALALLTVAILTWGSIGSMTLIFCLILMGLSLLWHWSVYTRDENCEDYQKDW